MARPTQLGTIAGITGLMVVLPVLITAGISMIFPNWGALPLTAAHIVLVALGAWAFAAIFRG